MVNADQHGAQFPQFKALLDATAAASGDDPHSSSSCAEDESMAVGVRRMRLGGTDRRQRRRIGLAVLGDNEIIGMYIFIPIA